MSITVYCGNMFSGKSSILIMEAKKAIESGKFIKAFKPSIDTRHGVVNILSHDGLDFKEETGQDVISVAVESNEDSIYRHICNLKAEYALPDLILIDEAQFFPWLLEDLEAVMSLCNIDIVCCGLDCDSNDDPFGPMPGLLAKADYVHKLKASCAVCGKESGKTFRKLIVPSEQKILIGGSDLYEPRCYVHWKQGMEEKRNWSKV